MYVYMHMYKSQNDFIKFSNSNSMKIRRNDLKTKNKSIKQRKKIMNVEIKINEKYWHRFLLYEISTGLLSIKINKFQVINWKLKIKNLKLVDSSLFVWDALDFLNEKMKSYLKYKVK